jgi:glucuronosyltransferase
MMHYHCLTILGYLWNVPVALISTTSLYPWMHDMIGNPENPAFSSNNLQNIEIGNSFWNRFHNTFLFYWYKFNYLYDSPIQNELLQKYFGPDVPTLQELERNVSLVLMNTYFPINGIKPMTAALVEVGGLHIKNSGPELTHVSIMFE